MTRSRSAAGTTAPHARERSVWQRARGSARNPVYAFEAAVLAKELPIEKPQRPARAVAQIRPLAIRSILVARAGTWEGADSAALGPRLS